MRPIAGPGHGPSDRARRKRNGASRTGPLLRAACLASIALVVLAVPLAAAAPTRVVTITGATADPAVKFAGFDANPPKVFDFDRDGDMEIVAQNDNQWVYIFDGKSGAKLAELKTRFPSGWGARTFNGPEAYHDDGVSHLVVANSAAIITSYKFDKAASSSTKFVFTKEWDRRLSDCHSGPGMDAKPVIVDLDKDGNFEILGNTEERGLYALRANGQLYWKNCLGGGNAEPGVGDLNQDGWPDVVHVSDGGIVSALNGRTGGWMWSYNVRSSFNLGSASMPVGPGIGQLDGLTGPDVVIGARDSHDPDNWDNDHALLLALSSGGKKLWAKQHPEGNPLTYTRPIIEDADGNGRNEVYWGDWNTQGHKPPFDESEAWSVLGPGNVFRYDHAGNLVWRRELPMYWSNKDLLVADADGDGKQEVLANGHQSGRDGVFVLNLATGATESHISVYPWKVQRMPIVEDLWDNGRMYMVVPASPQATSQGAAFLVYDMGVPFSAKWPHVDYPKAGSGGDPPPPPPPPPPPGDFDATFTVPSNVNEWWVEVKVTANEAVAKVEAQVNDGSWVALSKNGWGTWSKSFHVPKGSKVEFRATSTGGATDESQSFTWLGPADGGGDFAATFSPRAVGNDWWIEVAVTANQGIAKVEAQRNGGSWAELPKTDWGTYAKSLHAPDGTKVVFRATSSGGDTDTSSTYTW